MGFSGRGIDDKLTLPKDDPMRGKLDVSKREHIDQILRTWPYQPGMVLARRVRGSNGREVLQMRIEMGLLQMELSGRPDGQRPEGSETYFDHLLGVAMHEGDSFVLTQEQCDEIDREFVQFYHRRVCWLALREFRNAQRDADHTLALMDFSSAHAPDEQWVLSHEQYRPFVMFHEVQATALTKLQADEPAAAVAAIDGGLDSLAAVFARHNAEEHFDEDVFVVKLREMRESIKSHFELGPSLAEQLAEAVAAEQYELAAKLRDRLQRNSEAR